MSDIVVAFRSCGPHARCTKGAQSSHGTLGAHGASGVHGAMMPRSVNQLQLWDQQENTRTIMQA